MRRASLRKAKFTRKGGARIKVAKWQASKRTTRLARKNISNASKRAKFHQKKRSRLQKKMRAIKAPFNYMRMEALSRGVKSWAKRPGKNILLAKLNRGQKLGARANAKSGNLKTAKVQKTILSKGKKLPGKLKNKPGKTNKLGKTKGKLVKPSTSKKVKKNPAKSGKNTLLAKLKQGRKINPKTKIKPGNLKTAKFQKPLPTKGKKLSGKLIKGKQPTKSKGKTAKPSTSGEIKKKPAKTGKSNLLAKLKQGRKINSKPKIKPGNLKTAKVQKPLPAKGQKLPGKLNKGKQPAKVKGKIAKPGTSGKIKKTPAKTSKNNMLARLRLGQKIKSKPITKPSNLKTAKVQKPLLAKGHKLPGKLSKGKRPAKVKGKITKPGNLGKANKKLVDNAKKNQLAKTKRNQKLKSEANKKLSTAETLILSSKGISGSSRTPPSVSAASPRPPPSGAGAPPKPSSGRVKPKPSGPFVQATSKKGLVVKSDIAKSAKQKPAYQQGAIGKKPVQSLKSKPGVKEAEKALLAKVKQSQPANDIGIKPKPALSKTANDNIQGQNGKKDTARVTPSKSSSSPRSPPTNGSPVLSPKFNQNASKTGGSESKPVPVTRNERDKLVKVYKKSNEKNLFQESLSTVPYKAGVVRNFTTERTETYYRVYSGNDTQGGFLTKIPPKSSKWAREALNLPPENKAIMVQKVVVPAGIDLERSRASGGDLYGGRGGAEQFKILPGQKNKGIIFEKGNPLN